MWFWLEWPEETKSLANAEAIFSRCAKKDSLPVALVKMRGGLPIATVSLLETSVHSHPHLRPWVAALFVLPQHRHKGIGMKMVAAAAGKAHGLGFEAVYIGISDARAVYENAGWNYHETGVAGEKSCMIFKKIFVQNGIQHLGAADAAKRR